MHHGRCVLRPSTTPAGDFVHQFFHVKLINAFTLQREGILDKFYFHAESVHLKY